MRPVEVPRATRWSVIVLVHAGDISCFSDAALAAAATRWSRESSTKDLARAAKQAGKLGQQMSELTDEVRHTREAIDNSGSTPVGSVIKGLAARRMQG